MQVIVRDILGDLPEPPALVYLNWDTVTDNSRAFLLYCNASEDGFGATLEEEPDNLSVCPILFSSCTAIESECYWTSLDLELASIVWSITRLRGYLRGTTPRIFFQTTSARTSRKCREPQPTLAAMVENPPSRTYT